MVRRMYVVRPTVSAAWEERRRRGQVLERETAAGSTGAIVAIMIRKWDGLLCWSGSDGEPRACYQVNQCLLLRIDLVLIVNVSLNDARSPLVPLPRIHQRCIQCILWSTPYRNS